MIDYAIAFYFYLIPLRCVLYNRMLSQTYEHEHIKIYTYTPVLFSDKYFKGKLSLAVR